MRKSTTNARQKGSFVIVPPITQTIKGGGESICGLCFHLEICFAKKNQPCIKCTRYTPAAEMVKVKHGRWIDDGTGVPLCSVCYSSKPTKGASSVIDHELIDYEIRYCYFCGAKMNGGVNDAVD